MAGVLMLLLPIRGATAATSHLAPDRITPTRGPLVPSSANPRYFADASGRIVYLAGSHTWSNLADGGTSDPPPTFDYTTYLDFLERMNHNFLRLWTWEHARWADDIAADFWITPLPYLRTGPGRALDGKPAFDLTQFDPKYFDRLRRRVMEARDRGIYVAVMLFQGWSADDKERDSGKRWRSWRGSPFHKDNNVNGIDGDLNRDGFGDETHTLKIPRITRLQEEYVRRVIDTVADLDNVLYEISNESRRGSREWQYHMINFVKSHEAAKGPRHPVGMTVEFPDGDNGVLWNSPADWISPRGELDDSPATDGRKVVLLDTDHLCGICGDRGWAWRSFTRGYNLLLMDPYDGRNWGMPPGYEPANATWVNLRRTLGYTITYANRLDLSRMKPRGDLADTSYCLASVAGRDSAYLVYRPARRGAVIVDLRGAQGPLSVEWLNPQAGTVHPGSPVLGGEKQAFTAPFNGDAVLFIQGTPPASGGRREGGS